MRSHSNVLAGFGQIVKAEGGVHDHIHGVNGGKRKEFYEATGSSILRSAAHIQNGSCIGLRVHFINTYILNIIRSVIGLDHRIQDHGVGPGFVGHPALGQRIDENVGISLAYQGYGHIVTIFSVCIFEIGRGHDHNHIFLVLIIEQDLICFCENGHKAAYIQGIFIALQPGIIGLYDNGFFHPVGSQVVHHIGVGIYALVF